MLLVQQMEASETVSHLLCPTHERGLGQIHHLGPLGQAHESRVGREGAPGCIEQQMMWVASAPAKVQVVLKLLRTDVDAASRQKSTPFQMGRKALSMGHRDSSAGAQAPGNATSVRSRSSPPGTRDKTLGRPRSLRVRGRIWEWGVRGIERGWIS